MLDDNPLLYIANAIGKGVTAIFGSRNERLVKELLPILSAGGTFAMTTLLGLVAGIVIAQRTGQQLWVFGGLCAGLVLGGYTAYRLLTRSM